MNHGNVSPAGVRVWGKGIEQGYPGNHLSRRCSPECPGQGSLGRRSRRELTKWGPLSPQPLLADALSLLPWRGRARSGAPSRPTLHLRGPDTGQICDTLVRCREGASGDTGESWGLVAQGCVS